jgi:hypothetical protein
MHLNTILGSSNAPASTSQRSLARSQLEDVQMSSLTATEMRSDLPSLISASMIPTWHPTIEPEVNRNVGVALPPITPRRTPSPISRQLTPSPITPQRTPSPEPGPIERASFDDVERWQNHVYTQALHVPSSELSVSGPTADAVAATLIIRSVDALH